MNGKQNHLFSGKIVRFSLHGREGLLDYPRHLNSAGQSGKICEKNEHINSTFLGNFKQINVHFSHKHD